MSIHPLWLALFILCAIIPALIVAVVFIVRFESLKGDVTTSNLLVDNEIKAFALQLDGINTKSKLSMEALEAAQKVSMKLVNLEESFVALTNKWNSRERAERQAEKRAQKRKEEEGEEEIPGTVQESMSIPLFDDEELPQQPEGKRIVKSDRPFGSLPTHSRR